MLPFLSKMLFFLYHNIKNTGVSSKIKEMKKNQYKSIEELRKIQQRKLQQLLLHAYNHVPYYKKIFNQLGIDPKKLHYPENFTQIPFLSKKLINQYQKDLIASNFRKKDLIKNHTSGSTGEALYFYMDKNSNYYRRALLLRHYQWIGIEWGDRIATLWGAPFDIKKSKKLRGKLHGYINNLLFLSSYNLSEDNMDIYLNKLLKFKPKLLVSYPGPLTVFSEFILNKSQKIPGLKAIITSAETLFPWQRELIEKAFQVPVYNRYGCREFGDMAQECKKRRGLHVDIDFFYIEIVDDKGNPFEDPYENEGELIITSLINYGMPFIRYKIGDVGKLSKKKCPCGMTLPMFSSIEGRTLDIIKTPNGNKLGGTFWTILFRSKPGIKSFQVIQKQINSITVKYIKDPNIHKINLNWFENKIKEKCGKNFIVNFKEVKEIPKTPSGKTRFVISELDQKLRDEEE